MSMTYAVDTSYKPVNYMQAQNITSSNSLNTQEDDISILTASKENKTNKIDIDSTCTDGKNDGKLEDGVVGLFLKKTGENILKKIASPVTEALKGNFVPAIITAAGIALAANPITGPFAIAIGTGAAALGVASSAVAVGSDIKALNECANTEGTTDADAKAIVAQMGDHASNGVLSLTALIGGTKFMRNKAGTNMNNLKLKAASGEKVSLRQQLGAYGKDTLNAGCDMAKAGFGKLTTPVRQKAEIIKDTQAQKHYAKDNKLSNQKLSQDEIDALIKELDTDAATQQQFIKNKSIDGQKTLSQTEIDELVKTYSTEGKLSQTEIDELVKTYSTEGKLSQTDVDKIVKTYSTNNVQTPSSNTRNIGPTNENNNPIHNATKQVADENLALERLLKQKPTNTNSIEYAEWSQDVAKCKNIIQGKNKALNIYQTQLDEAFFTAGFDT